MVWQPPETDAVATGWQPPAGDAVESPAYGGTALENAGQAIQKGMNFINNPGGGPPAGTIAMQPGGDNLFQGAADRANSYLAGKGMNPYLAATIATPIAMANPENWLTNPSAIPDKFQLPGAETAQDVAQSAARRTLGYAKGMLKKPGALERANEVGQTMLDQGVIKNPLTSPLSFGAEDTYGRASDLADTTGQAIGNTVKELSSVGRSGIDGLHLAQAVDSQIGPSLSGGLYSKDASIVNEIKDTILAHGQGELNLNSLQALKQKLGDAAKFNTMTDATKASLYRQAYGIVNSEIERSVGNLTEGTPMGEQYLQNKAVYGASKEAEKALLNRISSEAGNRRIGLTDTITAGAELAAGHPGVAAGLIGIKHGIENAGNALTARIADYLARSGTLGKSGVKLGLSDLIAANQATRNQGRQ